MASLVGLISDTHGVLRPEALEALRDCEVILHAGDVGDPAILDALARVAPVRAVRGNVDRGGFGACLAPTEIIDIAGRSIYLLHDLGQLDLDPSAAGFAAVVSGHSHRAAVHEERGVLYVNPGSAGPRRFKLPVSVGRLQLSPSGLHAEIIVFVRKDPGLRLPEARSLKPEARV